MDNKSDIIEKLTAVGLKTNWGLVDRVDCVPEPIEVIRDAIGEILTLREALCEACEIIANRSGTCPHWYFDDGCDSFPINCKKKSKDCWRDILIERAKWTVSKTPEPSAAELYGKYMNTGDSEQ